MVLPVSKLTGSSGLWPASRSTKFTPIPSRDPRLISQYFWKKQIFVSRIDSSGLLHFFMGVFFFLLGFIYFLIFSLATRAGHLLLTTQICLLLASSSAWPTSSPFLISTGARSSVAWRHEYNARLEFLIGLFLVTGKWDLFHSCLSLSLHHQLIWNPFVICLRSLQRPSCCLSSVAPQLM